MALSLIETTTISELAQILYPFLPANPHPYAKDVQNSFPGIAHDLGLTQFWIGGSKLPAIEELLKGTFEKRRNSFSALMVTIVQRGISYRSRKGQAVNYEEIKTLNDCLVKLKFKIPELWDQQFLDALPGKPKPVPTQATTDNTISLDVLKKQLQELGKLEAQSRGYAFEKFLNSLFEFSGLKPRAPFRLTGEQIDGSIQLAGNTYLIEAKWQKELTDNKDLLVFQGKVEGKSDWARGLFISYTGFSNDSLEAFSRGRSTKIIGLNGQDLFFILEGGMGLQEAIEAKARRAAETGEFLVTVQQFNLGL